MKRRKFLKMAGGVALASALSDFVGAFEPASLDMGSLFEANSPEEFFNNLLEGTSLRASCG